MTLIERLKDPELYVDAIGEAIDKLEEQEKAIHNLQVISRMGPRELCQKHSIQNCHCCEREECCDNLSPMKRRIVELEAMLDKEVNCEALADKIIRYCRAHDINDRGASWLSEILKMAKEIKA